MSGIATFGVSIDDHEMEVIEVDGVSSLKLDLSSWLSSSFPPSILNIVYVVL